MEKLKLKWFKPGMPNHDVVWNTNCDVLEEHGRIYGHSNCSKSTICELTEGQEVNIGLWLKDQRRYIKRGGLSPGEFSLG